MSEQKNAAPIARIIVPLDAASDHRAAIETAARLAARAGVPLHGIFVEEEDLLHLARLPFSRQHTLGAAAEELTTEHVELHWRLAAERARRELAAAAEHHGIAVSLAIVRGASAGVLAGAAAGDLVVAGALTRPVGAYFRIERRWWSTLETAPGPALRARDAGGAILLLRGERGAVVARLLEIEVEPAETDTCDIVIVG
jgi:hypothetical protein